MQQLSRIPILKKCEMNAVKNQEKKFKCTCMACLSSGNLVKITNAPMNQSKSQKQNHKKDLKTCIPTLSKQETM